MYFSFLDSDVQPKKEDESKMEDKILYKRTARYLLNAQINFVQAHMTIITPPLMNVEVELGYIAVVSCLLCCFVSVRNFTQ